MNHFRFLTVLGFVFFGIMSRFIPHPPNFTAINSIALLAAYSFNHLGLALLTIFLTMLGSDLVIGFHSSLCFVYVSFGLIVWMGQRLQSEKSLRNLPFFLTTSSILFFILTNFGEWLIGSFYPKTLAGLETCYIAALPFLANQILGDLIYGAVIFGGLTFVEDLIPTVQIKN